MSSDGDKAVDGFEHAVRLYEVRWQEDATAGQA